MTENEGFINVVVPFNIDWIVILITSHPSRRTKDDLNRITDLAC